MVDLKKSPAPLEKILDPPLVTGTVIEQSSAFTINFSGMTGNKPARTVKIMFAFLSIFDIETKRQQFTTELVLQARWTEPTLKPKEVRDGTIWREKFPAHLWEPRLRFILLLVPTTSISRVFFFYGVGCFFFAIFNASRKIRESSR